LPGKGAAENHVRKALVWGPKIVRSDDETLIYEPVEGHVRCRRLHAHGGEHCMKGITSRACVTRRQLIDRDGCKRQIR